MRYELSILIPSRSEEFLKNTVEDILRNKEAKTEIIVGLDGEWSNPPLDQYPDVNVIYVSKPIGQRGITNLCAKLSKAEYVMKCDAHCSFDKGFDKKMIDGFRKVGNDVVMVPIMRNLWAFDWVCECGERKYQDKGKICGKCGKQMKKDIKWIAKERPKSTSYCFDSEPHFQYFREYSKRKEVREQARNTGFTETMSLQGSCFMITRRNYWEWEVCDDKAGSWGNQGIEVACSAWLTKHRVLVNHNTWYAHMFRTKAVNDFGFPYPQSGNEVLKTKKKIKNKFWNFEHPKQRCPVSWLLERFWPVEGWSDEDFRNLKEFEKRHNISKK